METIILNNLYDFNTPKVINIKRWLMANAAYE